MQLLNTILLEVIRESVIKQTSVARDKMASVVGLVDFVVDYNANSGKNNKKKIVLPWSEYAQRSGLDKTPGQCKRSKVISNAEKILTPRHPANSSCASEA